MSWTDPQPWQAQAACKSLPPEWWIEAPRNQANARWENAVDAIRVCQGCPVRAECLTFQLEFEADMPVEERWGIYGGLTPRQRAVMSRKGWRPGDPLPGVQRSGEALRRQALELVEQGYSYREVAEVQGCSIETISARIRRARECPVGGLHRKRGGLNAVTD